MQRTSINTTDWKQRLKAELARDKKKTGILAALLLVAGILGGRLVITHSLPSDASADQPGAAASPAPGDADADRQAPAPRGESGDNGDSARRDQYLAHMDRAIGRDLFAAKLSYFPPLPGAESLAVGNAQGDPGWFGMVQQLVLRKQQAGSDELSRVNAIRAQADDLSLQSTMLGSSPTALINGQVLRQGDYVSGFQIKRIAANRCLVCKDGVDVELRMNE